MKLRRSGVGAVERALAPAIVHQALASAGAPLEPAALTLMNSHFGQDFSHVRVHTDSQAAESARAVNSVAYTVGRDVVFADGAYDPWSASGQHLLAHELAHTLQQRDMTLDSTTPITVGDPSDHAEAEADATVSSGWGTHSDSHSFAHAGAVLRRQTTSSSRPAPAQQPEIEPPHRTYINHSVGRFGRFDADLEARGRPPGTSGPGYFCALTVTMRAKFNFDDSLGRWPAGRKDSWLREFIAVVRKRWSTRYLLLPATRCPNEGCAMIAVYVDVEPVTSDPHHEVTVYYRHPEDSEAARSNAGVPGGRSGKFFESDVRPTSSGVRTQTTAAHEAGHWLGLEHIHCNTDGQLCYGITAGQADDVMGRGEYVSGRDYQPFLETMETITGCKWRTDREGGLRAGSSALIWGLLGAGAGAILGAAIGGGGTALAMGLIYGGLAAGLGFLYDIS